MKKLLLLIVFVVGITNVFGTTYYWVGGAGSWGTASTASFASSSGGTGVALTPATGDNVIFDASSGTNPTVTLTANSTIANLTVQCGGTVTFAGAFTFQVSTNLTFSNSTKISLNNQKTFSLGGGGAFTMTGNDASNYFTGNAGNGYIQVATTGTLDLYLDPNFTWFNLAFNKGTVNLWTNCTTSRLGFSTNTTSLILKPNVIFSLISGSTSSLSTTGTVDASALGSKVRILSTAASILTASRQIFTGVINHLEMNSSGTYTPFSALTVNNLTLTAGIISNTTNNITLSNGGTITRIAGTLSSALASYGTTPNVVYSNTTATITGNELPSSVASLTIAGSNTVTLNAPLTITGTLNLTSNTLTNSATNNITFDGGLNPVEIFRTAGQIGGAGSTYPIFTTNVNVTYNGSSAINTGYEWPLTASKLTNLTVNNSAGATMASSRTVNGILQLTSGTLTTGSNTLTLKGTIAGSGLINTSTTGTLVFGGSAEQALSTANLTSGSVNILTVNAGSKLTTSGTIAATTLNILSNSGSGTGTLVDSGTLNATNASVQQYLSSARNWYLHSPVSGASSLPTVDGGTLTFYSYPENDANQATGANGYAAGAVWNTISSGTMAEGTGYIVKPSAATSTVTFTGTGLNTGDKTISGLTYTAANPKHGFNLIGNPYPSYINWNTAIRTNVSETMWYRTNVGGTYKYYTYLNGTGALEEDGLTVPAGVSNLIPPMQAFWVKVAASQTGSVQFLNASRAHKDEVGNQLRAPKQSNNKLVRLLVSNGINDDEAVIYFNSNVTNGLDAYDSQKMFNGSALIPEIYTTVGTDKLVINGMKEMPLNQEIALGFVPGSASSFSIKANEIKNLPSDVKVILKDNATNGLETDLTDGVSTYTFNPAENNTNRFSLLFRAPGTTTGFDYTSKPLAQVFVNAANQITISAPEKSNYAIYNAVGQLIDNGFVNSKLQTINYKLTQGVYMVNVNNQTTKVIIK